MIKVIAVGEYKNAILILRMFTDGFAADDGYDLRKFTKEFKVPLDKRHREKLAKYYDIYQRHAGYKGFTFQKFRDPKNLRAAQKAIGMPSNLSWRGAFIPTPSINTPAKLIKRKNKWVIEYEEQGVDTIFVPFDKMAFAELGIDYVRSLFADAPKNYKYNLDMGYGRNRWKAGGNLNQMLQDLSFIIERYGHYSDFVMGVHVYRATLDEFNFMKLEHLKTAKQRRVEQEHFAKIIKRERRKLTVHEEMRKFDRANVRNGYMTKAAYRKKYGEPF